MLNREALIEVAKSFGRFMWFGLIGLVVAFLTGLTTNTDLLSSTWSVAGVTMPVGTYIVIGIGLAIKALDRYRHVNPDTDSKGLAPSFLQK